MWPPLAATTLLAAGLEVSTFDLVTLPLGVDAFLLTRDFFSIAIVIFSEVRFLMPYAVTSAIEAPNFYPIDFPKSHRIGGFQRSPSVAKQVGTARRVKI